MSLTLINSVTVPAGGSASIDFPSIPAIYTDIYLVYSLRSNRAAGVDVVQLRFNGVTSGYSVKQLIGFGSGSGYSEGLGSQAQADSYGINGDTSLANTFSNGTLHIPNYTSSDNKGFSMDAVYEDNIAAAWQNFTAGTWANTSPISRITFTPTYGTLFKEGSTAFLYGVNKLPDSGLGKTPTVDYLVIAGGGSGGSWHGGGGGAGGYLTASNFAVAAGTALNVTIGAGGTTSSWDGYAAGGNGSASSFSTISATGGGGGGTRWNSIGGNAGGSGGGGGYFTAAGSGTSGQGYAGGAGQAHGSGGGGASGVGLADTSGASGGAGGPGTLSTIFGEYVYMAGGGGGGSQGTGSPSGAGGIGGGGSGGIATGGFQGQLGTGSGGGGGGAGSSSNFGGPGGSGIVVVRYPSTYVEPVATTGNPTVKVKNGFRTYTWTNSGSITF